jgi:hypothetical protein
MSEEPQQRDPKDVSQYRWNRRLKAEGLGVVKLGGLIRKRRKAKGGAIARRGRHWHR